MPLIVFHLLSIPSSFLCYLVYKYHYHQEPELLFLHVQAVHIILIGDVVQNG